MRERPARDLDSTSYAVLRKFGISIRVCGAGGRSPNELSGVKSCAYLGEAARQAIRNPGTVTFGGDFK